MGITLPERLADKLSTDDRLTAAVHGTLAEFGPWVEYSGTPLFPEYTDHGPRHIEKVLTTASSLIRDEAWGIVTPMDAALLMLATLLHDSAMHLSEDGFLALVRGEAGQRRVGGFEEEAWPSLWDAYLHRARRWDSKKMEELFGESIEVRDPPDCKGEWTRFDRMLYGEFVRRNHGRFAHEAALHGVPGPDVQRLDVSQHFEEGVRGLGGLLARSHSLPVRAIMPHLRSRYHLRDYNGAHAVFLATVLRVADYLEASPERAAGATLSVAPVLSPLSRAEAGFNEAIEQISCEEDDPEALFARATPQDVCTFLKVSEWLANVQAELDASWAVLGEVYGRHQALAPLGLTIRRVHSSLDNTAEFARQASYVPRKVRMEVARSEVLPLLTGPLYDDVPTIGVRELLQNALDAVRELRDYLAHRAEGPAPDLYEQDGDVEICIEARGEDTDLFVTVTDKGIGMTEDVICDYFLTVGGTYRASDEWKDLHERSKAERPDVGTPASRVLRSGRFGVGVLAAFLLGEEITVTTRHVGAAKDRALTFTLKPDTEPVQITYCSAPVGTRVQVRATPRAVKELLDHEETDVPRVQALYLLDDPVVVFRVGASGKSSALKPTRTLPRSGAVLPLDWHRIDVPGYDDVQWSDWQRRPHVSPVVCNGIPVGDGRTRGARRLGETQRVDGAVISAPLTSVFDPDAQLRLDLPRCSVVPDPELEKTLRADVLQWLFAWMLIGLPELSAPHSIVDISVSRLVPTGVVWSIGNEVIPVATDSGYTMHELLSVLFPDGLTACVVSTYTRGQPASRQLAQSVSLLPGRAPNVLVRLDGHRPVYPLENGLLNYIGALWPCDTIQNPWSIANGTFVEAYLSDSLDEALRARMVVPAPPSIPSAFAVGLQYGDGSTLSEVDFPVVLATPGCPPSLLLAASGDNSGAAMRVHGVEAALEVFAETAPPRRPEDDFIREAWMDTFGAPVIPYSVEQRRDELPAAYRRLERHIKSAEHAVRRSRKRWGHGGLP